MSLQNNVYKKPTYYIEFDALLSFPDDIANDVEIGYISDTSTTALWSDGGALTATYNSLAEFITALNAAQDIFEFYELPASEIQRTGKIVSLLGIKTATRQMPETYINTIQIEFAAPIVAQPDLQILYPDNTTADLTNQLLVANNTLLQASSTTAATSVVTTAAGSPIATGAKYIHVENTGAAVGTWNGASIPAGVAIPHPTNGKDTLPAIAYDATGTTFVITVIR